MFLHRWCTGAGGSLKDAQLAKLDALVKLAGVEKDHHVLEIGCGWGSLAIRAVETTGCRSLAYLPACIFGFSFLNATRGLAGLGSSFALLYHTHVKWLCVYLSECMLLLSLSSNHALLMLEGLEVHKETGFTVAVL